MAQNYLANPVSTQATFINDFKANTLIYSKSPLGFGAFATTLMTLSLSMMGFRGVSNQTVFVGNLCFLAGIGLLISAQWEMVKGNTFAYTLLAAFGKSYVHSHIQQNDS